MFSAQSTNTANAANATRFEVVLPSGHRLLVRHADLTGETVDAIVNAANVGLAHGGGVAGAIVRKGGMIIQDESDRVGRVPTGGAAATGAGSLPAKFVIHAVGPVWRGQSPEESDRLLASAVVSSLEIARQKNLENIAFPAISSGIFGFPKPRCAEIMIKAVLDWCENHAGDAPREIRFTNNDELTVNLFEAELRRRFDGTK